MEGDIGKRIVDIEGLTTCLIFQYEPSFVCYESVLFGRNVTNALNTAKIIAGIEYAAHKTRYHITSHPPAKIKKVITGNGRAKKEEMAKGVSKFIDYKKSDIDVLWYTQVSHHVIDAVAVGISGIKLYVPQNPWE